MEPAYLVRYGVMGQVGRFLADDGERFERGRSVVVRSHRGTELGEVLIPAPEGPRLESPEVDGLARILRPAHPNDLDRARRAEGNRSTYFQDCLRILGGGTWPIDLLDVEPLLDEDRLVLHYLGPHKLDVAGLLAVFRDTYRYDVMFQPVGRDEDEDEDDHRHGCGSCGSGSGCGTGVESGRGGSSGCGGCEVKKLLTARR
ncbi:MAG: PSP1 C-terminal domain-containing protein [Isosphaeraceae bacterium]